MSMGKGARVSRKGKFFIVNLVMEREGTNKSYETPYGTYQKAEEAKKHCWRLNRVLNCGRDCRFMKDCAAFSKSSGY